VFMADGGFKDRLGEGSAVQGRAKMKKVHGNRLANNCMD
jgi:hypothetical protein